MVALDRTGLASALFILTCGLARAQSPETDDGAGATVDKTEDRSLRSVVVPRIEVDAGTDDKGRIAAGVEVWTSMDLDWDVVVAPTFGVATPSGKGLLELSSQDSPAFDLGVAFQFREIPPTTPSRTPGPEVRSTIARAFEACAELIDCTNPADSKAEPDYCKALEDGVTAAEAGIGDVCSEKTPKFDLGLRYPRWMIDVGGRVAVEQFKFREFTPTEGYPDVAAGPVGSIDPKDQKEIKVGGDASIGFTHVSPSLRGHVLTVEFQAAYGHRWSASKDTVEWCLDQGTAITDTGVDTSAGEDIKVPAPAERCGTAALGAPTAGGDLYATLLLGGVTVPRDRWRWSIGPFVQYRTHGKEQGAVRLGVHLPIHVNLAKIDVQKGKFTGILRVTPAIAGDWGRASEDDDGFGAYVRFDVLTTRTLVGGASTWSPMNW